MKTGYGLPTGDSLGYLGYTAKPYASLPYSGYSSKGYSSLISGLKPSKYGAEKDTVFGRVKKLKPRKLPSSDKIDTPLYKKKTFDFTDYAYREAVNRLKFLLTEAYEPTKVATSIYYRGLDDVKSEASDNQSVVERPSITEVSKYFNPGALSRYQSGTSGSGRRYSFLNKDFGTSSALKPAVSTANLQPAPSVCSFSQNLEVTQPPPELLGFIEKQESYIEQLEKESQYCREELATLLKKVKDVVSENEALTDRARSKSIYQIDSSESEDLDLDRIREKTKLSGPSIVFESRISELEAQLAQSQIDLKKLFNENEENKRKLLHGASDANCSDVYRKQVENLQRDKHNLEESVRKLQLAIDQLKDTEATNFSKSQRSRDMIEHVAFERNQAEIEIRRLKDELERQHERVREVQHEMAKRLSEERANAERRYTFQVDQLGGDLSSQWEQATKLQLEVERMKRIESDYKRELNQKNSQIDELKMELKNKTAIFMSDLNQASAEKQSIEQEITSLRMQLERAERQSKVEVSRLNAEITSLRQRLDRADADLLHSKRENLKLSDEVASLEKELTLGDLNKETRPSKELAKIISDMEAKHAATVSELEGMVQDQKQLMDKLTAECKSLTHKLEDTTLQHKNEKKELRQTNNELMERLKQVWANYKEISPAFQKRKYSTGQLDADSNLSSASNYDPEEIDVLQNNFEFLSQRIETGGTAAASTGQDNQYASPSATVNDNRYPTEYASSRPTHSNYSNYPATAAATNKPTAAAGGSQSYSSPSPNQSVARDDVNYEAPKIVSRPGSTTAHYPPVRTVTQSDEVIGRSSAAAQPSAVGKSSRPESQISDRQYATSRQQPDAELSRKSSINEYNETKGSKYIDEKRSESRLSRASIPNEDTATKLQGKESEPGRTDAERLSRTSDSTTTKPDGTGSSGRLSRESIVGSERASRQSIRQPPAYVEQSQPSQYVSESGRTESVEQYQPTAVDQYPSQTGDMDQSYQQPYDETTEYDASQYDPSQQYDQSQYDEYGNQQYVQESYNQQGYEQQQQYQDYQQPYDAQQYTTEQVYDESSYPAGQSAQSPTERPAPAPTATPVQLQEQTESSRNLGYPRSRNSPGTTGNAPASAKQPHYKQPTGASNK